MTRDPASVPVQVIAQAADLPLLETALATAARVALDTETPIDGPERGRLRVMSIATRRHEDAHEQAFVVDVRDLDARLLGPILDGATAHAWNANFDARVVDAAVYASSDVTSGIGWWDCQLADALLHQGRSGFGWYHGLAWATEHYLGLTADGKGTTQLSYTAEDDLLVLGLLKGSFIFLADLVREIKMPLHVDFLVASSYGSGTVSSGDVQLLYDPDASLEGRAVLLVEDIIDSGNTMNRLIPLLEKRGPSSLEICALLHKRITRLDREAKWVGFDPPKEFLVGYGLDYSENFRHLPYIGSL